MDVISIAKHSQISARTEQHLQQQPCVTASRASVSIASLPTGIGACGSRVRARRLCVHENVAFTSQRGYAHRWRTQHNAGLHGPLCVGPAECSQDFVERCEKLCSSRKSRILAGYPEHIFKPELILSYPRDIAISGADICSGYPGKYPAADMSYLRNYHI